MWYTGETKAWRERAQLPLLNYSMQNKSHPRSCLERKTVLSTLGVAVDKRGISKIPHLEHSQGTWVSPALSSYPPYRNRNALIPFGHQILHYMDIWCEERAGGTFRQPRPGGGLEERQKRRCKTTASPVSLSQIKSKCAWSSLEARLAKRGYASAVLS